MIQRTKLGKNRIKLRDPANNVGKKHEKIREKDSSPGQNMSKRKMSNIDEQTSTSNLLIWFHLYDYGTGMPYKGTSATSVLRSSLVVPIIDQFRDAVKVKYDQPGYLKEVPSGTLKVFKNKDSFDKREADVGKVIYK